MMYELKIQCKGVIVALTFAFKAACFILKRLANTLLIITFAPAPNRDLVIISDSFD